jgi:Transposase DNA-binding
MDEAAQRRALTIIHILGRGGASGDHTHAMATGRSEAMSHGVEPELVACQLHAARHAKRLAQLGTRLREKPVQRMPRAGHGWAATVAA